MWLRSRYTFLITSKPNIDTACANVPLLASFNAGSNQKIFTSIRFSINKSFTGYAFLGNLQDQIRRRLKPCNHVLPHDLQLKYLAHRDSWRENICSQIWTQRRSWTTQLQIGQHAPYPYCRGLIESSWEYSVYESMFFLDIDFKVSSVDHSLIAIAKLSQA